MTKTPFTKILIANRGEIALRVMRTARDMGYQTVAVYSDADAANPHARAADQAVRIGGAAPAESYLNIAAIIAAARASGADAVHPGYGFLAENAEFAQACRDAGLVFIGPSPQAMRAMGDKAGAKALMRKAGAPVTPGYDGEDQRGEALAREAERIGFPVMIKACAGGGGRGMRLVERGPDFAAALASAQSEAQTAFGDSRVLLERAIVAPRHIEIQIVADRYGNCIHLGERDCSVQRRHQKIIEEAPSPAVSDDLRARMGEAAVAAAKAVGYEGAGTLEFLLDRDGNFFFMEMNTRLQVEHPVTEAITGLDLVALQLLVAAGEALPLEQNDVEFVGHAIEARLCAEDPRADFLPQAGTLGLWRAPADLRVETALESGAEVSPFYDSMIAKIIAHAPTREEAIRKLAAGLDDTAALGVATNVGFLARCLRHPVFGAGAATTAFIAGARGDLIAARADGPHDALLAALLVYLTHDHNRHRNAGRSLAPELPIPLRLEIDGAIADVGVHRERGGDYVTEGADARHVFTIEEIGPADVRFRFDGVGDSARFWRADDRLHILHRGRTFTARDLTLAAALRGGAGGGDGKLRAAMAGRVVALLAEVGAEVAAGQPILTLEAMKMEHVHRAPVAGRITALHAAIGDQATMGRVLAEIEAAGAAA
jgi:geranyl-CoA carboxylase alpha subunit